MSAERNRELIERFYAAFDRHDGDDDGRLLRAGCAVLGSGVRRVAGRAGRRDVADAHRAGGGPRRRARRARCRRDDGTAHWIAHYTFRTGRKVVNDIQAAFRFENGLIAEHDDSFDFYKWSRQALGPPGLLLGWTPLLRAKVQKEARAGLDEFLADDAQREDAPGP